MQSTIFHARPIYRSTELRAIEKVAAHQALMQRAGLAAADLACALCADRGAAVLVLAGPGNNGGDAFVMAHYLRERFYDVHLVFIGDPARLPEDAQLAQRQFDSAGGHTFNAIPEKPWSLIVDGLFGLGLQREITGRYAELIAVANRLAARDRCPLLALDCPSGLDADTGQRRGATIRASHTLSFIAYKPGLLTGDGPDYCGEISIADLALDAPKIATPDAWTIDIDLFAEHLRPRAKNSHKGSYGNAGILGGANGMVGAAVLAGRAALKLGSGRVYLGLLDPQAPSFDTSQPELMRRPPDALFATELTVLACGPGLGNSMQAHRLLEQACALDLPLLLDADALNLLATTNASPTVLIARVPKNSPRILTPHPAEASRLLACDTLTVQADRLAAASDLAHRYNAIVALKGCGTIVATPDGRRFINTTGNAGLATAGTGDVLTGIVTALLAQGWPALGALLAAVHLHGLAADRLVAQGQGPIGLTASELIDSARACLNDWIVNASACN